MAIAFNVNEKMNSLLLKCFAATGEPNPGDCVNLDFGHQFIAAKATLDDAAAWSTLEKVTV